MSKVCNMDCFNCKFDDCIKNDVYSESSRYCNRSEEYKQYQREYQKKKRDEAREKGYCIVCLKRPATNGAKCLECYLRQKRYDKSKCDGRRQMWIEEGRCYFCGGEVKEGKKVCEKHYRVLFENTKKVNDLPQTKEAQKIFTSWFWKKMEAEKVEKKL